MSIIENKYPAIENPSEDYQGYGSSTNGYSTHYDNNNVSRSNSYLSNPKGNEKPRGDPTFLFWTLVVFLFILAVGNLILTFVILGVLRLGQGMESLELVSEENLIKLFGITDLDVIYKRNGHLEGYTDVPVEITGDSSSIIFRIDRGAELAPSIDIGLGRSMVQVDSFQVKHPATGIPIFSTDYPNFGLPRGVETLDVEIAQTKRVASPIDGNLSLRSETVVKLKGSEGTRLEGKEVLWSADQDIFLKSVNKSIVLSGSEGVYIDVREIPIAATSEGQRSQTQYKICVCMPGGRLFRVPVKNNDSASCHLTGIAPKDHPCL